MQSANDFFDGFPVEAGHPSLPIHQAIDSDIRNAATLRNTSVPSSMLFPTYYDTPSEEMGAWIVPLVERYAWNRNRNADPDLILNPLAGLLRLVLWEQEVDDETLLRLVEHSPSLLSDHHEWECYRLPFVVLANLKLRPGPLRSELGKALRGLVAHLEQKPDHSLEMFLIGFRLFLEGYYEVPWALDVGEEFPKGDSWQPLMRLVIAGTTARGSHGEQIGPTAQVIRRAGVDRITNLVNQVAASMEKSKSAEISAAGCLLFEQMMHWVKQCPELNVDEALYKICGVNWAPVTFKGVLFPKCLKGLMEAVARREATRAFACAERLANHPQLKSFIQVQRLYEQLLAETVGFEPALGTGVDGYPLATTMDVVVDQVLRYRAEWPAGSQWSSLEPFGPKANLDVAFRQMKHDFPGALQALNARIEWMSRHAPQPEVQFPAGPWLSWGIDLGDLYQLILREKPQLSWEDLAALCRAEQPKWLSVKPSRELLECCQDWIANHGSRKELTAAIEIWRKTVYGPSAGAQAIRKGIDWLLWCDPNHETSEKVCWSALIRNDMRRMPESNRKAWSVLLQNVSFANAEKPTKGWLKVAEKAMRMVDREEFRAKFRAWLEPFRRGEGIRISVAGRDLMVALFWYSLLAADPEVDEAVLWFSQANWKTKADRKRTERLLPVWTYTIAARSPEKAIDTIHRYRDHGGLALTGRSLKTYKALCERFGIESEIHAPAAPVFDLKAHRRETLKGMLSQFVNGESALDEDVVRVNGATGEQYQIGLIDGRILRMSDGKPVRLEIDWNESPFQPFKQMIDWQDLRDPFAPNLTRVVLCAQILSGALGVEVPIVVDEG